MSRRAEPPFPTGDSWQRWALQLSEYLRNRDLSQAEVLPQTVLLEHQISTRPAKALQDGMLMFDPVNGTVLVSLAGVWTPMPLTLDGLKGGKITAPSNGESLIWDEDEASSISGSASGTGSANVPITQHNSLADRDVANAHPITAITDFILNGPPVVGDGFVWSGTKWENLSLWVASGYGGLRQGAPVGIPNIGSGWTVLVADEGTIATPRAVVQSTANNSIRFTRPGVWRVSVGVSLTHNESNGSRTFGIRMFDITSATAGYSTIIGVGRNTDTTTWQVSLLLEITPAQLSDEWRVEVGGTADSLTNVIENSFTFSVNTVSEYRG